MNFSGEGGGVALGKVIENKQVVEFSSLPKRQKLPIRGLELPVGYKREVGTKPRHRMLLMNRRTSYSAIRVER